MSVNQSYVCIMQIMLPTVLFCCDMSFSDSESHGGSTSLAYMHHVASLISGSEIKLFMLILTILLINVKITTFVGFDDCLMNFVSVLSFYDLFVLSCNESADSRAH